MTPATWNWLNPDCFSQTSHPGCWDIVWQCRIATKTIIMIFYYSTRLPVMAGIAWMGEEELLSGLYETKQAQYISYTSGQRFVAWSCLLHQRYVIQEFLEGDENVGSWCPIPGLLPTTDSFHQHSGFASCRSSPLILYIPRAVYVSSYMPNVSNTTNHIHCFLSSYAI